MNQNVVIEKNQNRYARAIEASKRARWAIDDVLRGRTFAATEKLMPDGLSLAARLPFLDETSRRLLSQVQGRTYARFFGLIERFVNAKILEVGQRHLFGDQVALEAMVRFSDEELKHQELFRRVERLAAAAMPPGYRFTHDANAVAAVVLGKSTWAVLGLTCVVELVTQAHYLETIEGDEALSPLFRDVFRFHWMEESQHAVVDELEWRAEDRKLDAAQRDAALSELIELVGAVDALVCAQAVDDAAYFEANVGRALSNAERDEVRATFVAAYRWQYVGSGVERTRFPEVLRSMITEEQLKRVERALTPFLGLGPKQDVR